jgi:pyrroloquinoline quinone biosynthesis protein D
MPTDRSGRGRIAKASQRKTPQSKRATRTRNRGGVRLAPGVRLDGGEKPGDMPVLVYPSGKVQLNEGAVAILRLCDGSRNRDAIVAELSTRSRGQSLPRDIAAFLEVACARGWIVDP